MVPRAHIPQAVADFCKKSGLFGGLAALGSALAVLMGATAANAFEREGVLDQQTVETCLTAHETPAQLYAALALLGWQGLDATAPGEPGEVALRGLSLNRLFRRMGEAAASAQQWQQAWDFAQANAKGDLRKITPPDSPVSHMLFSSNGGSVLRVDTIGFNWGLRASCTLVLSPADMAQTLAGVQQTFADDLQAQSPFRNLPGFADEDGALKRSFLFTLVNEEILADKLGTSPGFAGLLSTHLAPEPPAQ